MKTKIIVSACLLGENCRYDGKNNKNEKVLALSEFFTLVPVCPECFGGLPVPRTPSEIYGERVVTKDGEDVTQAFSEGAEATLYICMENNCPAAVLKERSPSCGCKKIYDGTFTKTLTDGYGVTAKLLLENNIQVFGESEISRLIELYT